MYTKLDENDDMMSSIEDHYKEQYNTIKRNVQGLVVVNTLIISTVGLSLVNEGYIGLAIVLLASLIINLMTVSAIN